MRRESSRNEEKEERHATVLDGGHPLHDQREEGLFHQHERNRVEQQLREKERGEKHATPQSSTPLSPRHEPKEEEQTPHDEAHLARALQLLRLDATDLLEAPLLLLSTPHASSTPSRHALKHLDKPLRLPIHLHAHLQLVALRLELLL